MLKLILSILIIVISSGIGFLLSNRLDNRTRNLQELITILKVLESEMFYRMDPLPRLLQRIGADRKGLAGSFFVQVYEGLSDSYNYDFYGSWANAVNKIYGATSLSEQDRKIATEVGIALGKTDLENQKAFFTEVYERLNQQLILANESKHTKGKLYQTLLTALGIMTVIVLL